MLDAFWSDLIYIAPTTISDILPDFGNSKTSIKMFPLLH